ncbi:MAG: diaminopropionate ammonia-lyase [Deltaproteobacteria bacterium]|nr:diaminopropionate ammonia-lyase [Deltaproteobacteria bacterium]
MTNDPRHRFVENRFRTRRLEPEWRDAPGDVAAFHRSLPGYAPTPLAKMPALAAELGVGEIWVKDESRRFGLNAFKVLGAAYAIQRFVREHPALGPTCFATATDGNHGRAVAWAARRLGHRAVIFVPRNTVAARIEAIRAEGAEVVVVDGTYDDTVLRAASDAASSGWQVISDTAYPGYVEIPRWIVEGYGTLFHETAQQLDAQGAGPPDVVLLQAGVGGLACAGALFYARRNATPPALIAVEPTDADCLLESAASPDGSIRIAKGRQDSIMAGLNCGTPSLLAWPIVRAWFDAFLAVDDAYAEQAMRRLAAGTDGDPAIVSGESGAAGLAGLLALCREPALRDAARRCGLGPSARILLISTEGDTDPASYRRIVDGAS